MAEKAYNISKDTFPVDVDKLLLWDKNPRLKLENYSFEKSQIDDLETQESLRKLIKQNSEHKLEDLINSIKNDKFKDDNPIYVDLHNGTDKYFVIEGNRRLAAVKSLHKEGDNRVKSIPCYRFNYNQNSGVDYESALNLLVAEQHYIGGKVKHDGIVKALVFYDTYMSFLLQNSSVKTKVFRLVDKPLSQTLEFLNESITIGELKAELAIAVIYKQLMEVYQRELERDKNKIIRERLFWVYQNADFFHKEFGFSKSQSLRLGRNDLNRFYSLFVRKNCAVSNKGKLEKLIKLTRQRDWKDPYMDSIVKKPTELEKLYNTIVLKYKITPKGEKEPNKRGIAEGLEDAIGILKRMTLDDFANSKKEQNLVNELGHWFERLERLVTHDTEISDNTGTQARGVTGKKEVGQAGVDDVLGVCSSN